MRTHLGGSLRASGAGARVTLCGWVARRRDHGGVIFVDLRDAGGIVQAVLDPTVPGLEDAHRLRGEWVVRITGEVRHRPEGTVNPDLATGEIEIAVDEFEVLSAAEPPPIPVDDRADVDEALRLRYRYLDLRRPRLQRNLRLRARVAAAVRRSMDEQGFVEVETPTLTRSTPEGARDFLVPSRLQAGSCYALPQSPQLFKQLLMVAGVDRYYQIAHCWRDEDLRADRAPEFTQLDAELAFAGPDDVMAAIEEAVASTVEAVTGTRPGPFDRMTWHDAMARYGTDKPDRRFAIELVDLSEVFAQSDFRAFASKHVVGLRVEGGATTPRARLDEWTERAKALGAGGLVWMRVTAGGLDSPVAKFLGDVEHQRVPRLLAAADGDLVLLVADDDERLAQQVLGALRLDLGRPARTDEPLDLCWIVDFPLFDELDEDGRPHPAHHPFTAPHPEDLGRLESEPLRVRSLAYDLVCNGFELGSGSVRIHDRALQERIFGLLGIGSAEARLRFGFLLEAFRYGVPPHAGFAFGIDRLAMILAGEHSIREVIAFPKTQTGADLLTGAPAPVEADQLREVGLALLPHLRPDAQAE